MRVTVHIGPHKTGTSTVQKSLLRAFGSSTPLSTWYPIFEGRPTHNGAVLDCIKKNDCSVLVDCIKRAEASDCQHLIFSAEAFCLALPHGLPLVKSIFSEYKCELICTLSAPYRRAVSLAQEHIKHGHHRWLSENPRAVIHHPSFAPHLFSSFIDELNPEVAHLVIISKEDDEKELLKNFALACALKERLPQVAKENSRFGEIEIAAWAAINRVIADRGLANEVDYGRMRQKLVGLFSSESWQKSVPKIALEVPPELAATLKKISKTTYDELSSLQNLGIIEVLGRMEALLET